MTTNVSERSFENITSDHLRRLTSIALHKLNELFERRPDHSGQFSNSLMMLALCQGGAQHLVHGDRGVKDLDVWAFFHELPGHRFPPRLRLKADFGDSILGRHPDDDPKRFRGRRVDILGRDIPLMPDWNSTKAVQNYLAQGRTESARLLALRPVVALWPDHIFMQIIWQPQRGQS